MQYSGKCLKPNCDIDHRAPSERQARNGLRDHLEESGHVGRLTGVYDSPRMGGFYTAEGRVNDLSRETRMDIEDELRAMSQLDGQYRERDDPEMWAAKHDRYERVKSLLEAAVEDDGR